MREIKFRAWDNLEKRMRKVVSLHWQGDKIISARLEGDNEPIPIEGRLVIEQFTGLSDKNGVEICAGDILKSKIYGKTFTRKIIYCPRLASFGVEARIGKIFHYTISELWQLQVSILKVVGNAHEKPELLEER